MVEGIVKSVFMSLENFSQKLNLAIKNKIKDESLLSNKARLLRGSFLFNLLSYINKVINYLRFKNDLLFIDGKAYIKFNDLYFEIVNKYFLKRVDKPFVSKANLIIKFLDKFKFVPKIIVDVGACWGEYSLILGKHFNKGSIYAIEGSYENYKILCNNISFKLNNVQNVKPYNYIISDSNNFKYITNTISTTNIVKNEINKEDLNYSKVNSIKLSNFLNDNNLTYIDFLKLDIEGHELNLISDILDLDIKYGQIEIININSLEKNLEFLKLLTNKYILIDSENFKEIDFNELKNYVEKKFNDFVAFDIFIVSKSIYHS